MFLELKAVNRVLANGKSANAVREGVRRGMQGGNTGSVLIKHHTVEGKWLLQMAIKLRVDRLVRRPFGLYGGRTVVVRMRSAAWVSRAA